MYVHVIICALTVTRWTSFMLGLTVVHTWWVQGDSSYSSWCSSRTTLVLHPQRVYYTSMLQQLWCMFPKYAFLWGGLTRIVWPSGSPYLWRSEFTLRTRFSQYWLFFFMMNQSFYSWNRNQTFTPGQTRSGGKITIFSQFISHFPIIYFIFSQCVLN